MNDGDGILYRKLRDLIASCEQLDMQNEINRAQLQSELANRFRLTRSEIGQILADMMEQDIIRKENRLRVRLRR